MTFTNKCFLTPDYLFCLEVVILSVVSHNGGEVDTSGSFPRDRDYGGGLDFMAESMSYLQIARRDDELD